MLVTWNELIYKQVGTEEATYLQLPTMICYSTVSWGYFWEGVTINPWILNCNILNIPEIQF